MTITAIGILLIVIGVLLWAIMTALHRHTVVLNALKAQMETLVQKTRSEDASPAATKVDPAEECHGSAGKWSPKRRTGHVDS